MSSPSSKNTSKMPINNNNMIIVYIPYVKKMIDINEIYDERKVSAIKTTFDITTCSECNQPNVWRGEPLPMELSYINGKMSDASLTNLRIVCPNCNNCIRNKQTRDKTGKHFEEFIEFIYDDSKRLIKIYKEQLTDEEKTAIAKHSVYDIEESNGFIKWLISNKKVDL